MSADLDRAFMGLALTLARRGLGTTAPNPSVGAVLADPATSKIVGVGATQPGGRPHAETVALAMADERAAGAILYVTLEPCAHHGQTPPCTDAIIAAQVARVVVAIRDPAPHVGGQGIAALIRAGIPVDEGLGADEARHLAAGHIACVTLGRPFVQLKLAAGADGRVPKGGKGAPVWVTGEEARARGHLLRAEADAILIGAGTLIADNPDLTCRLPGMAARSPVRVVLSSGLQVPVDARVFATANEVPAWVICAEDAGPGAIAVLEAMGVRVMPVAPGADGRPDPARAMAALAAAGITRVLVEGGPALGRALMHAHLIDEVALFHGAQPAPGDSLLPFETEGLDPVLGDAGFAIAEARAMGDDTLTIWRRDG